MSDEKFKTVICENCGWTHFAVTRAHAEEEVRRFNEYFESLTKGEQDFYYGGKPSTIRTYERCEVCGGTKFKVGNTAPRGSTIGPVIFEEQKVEG